MLRIKKNMLKKSASIFVCIIVGMFSFYIDVVRAEQTDFLYPIFDGINDSSAWTTNLGASCSSALCYQHVDEMTGSSCNGNSDGNTSYIETNQDQAIQTFPVDLSTIPDGASVVGISVTVCNQRSQTNAMFKTVSCVNGTCTPFSSDISPTSGYDENQQLHGVSFTKNANSNVEIGVQSTNNRRFRVSQVRARIVYTVPIDTPATSSSSQSERVPPVVRGVNVKILSDKTVSVSFSTNESTIAEIHYGSNQTTSEAFAYDNNYGFQHTLLLQAVNGTAPFYYRIKAIDLGGNVADDGVRTIDLFPPILLNVRIASISVTSTQIAWQTDEETSAKVYWGESPSLGQESQQLGIGREHMVSIDGLQPGKIYFFQVSSSDVAGNNTSGSIRGFMTSPNQTDMDTIPLLSPANVQAELNENHAVKLSWKPSVQSSGLYTVIYRKSTTDLATALGSIVYSGNESTFVDTSAPSGSLIYTFFTKDSKGSFSLPVEIGIGKSLKFLGSRDAVLFEKPMFLGMRGKEVAAVKKLLRKYGYLKTIKDSSLFDLTTQRAVKNFQKNIGAVSSGVLLGSQVRILNSGVIPFASYTSKMDDFSLNSSLNIVVVQKFLLDFGYLPYDVLPSGRFGKLTERALKQFQNSRQLVPSGKIDTLTIQYLRALSDQELSFANKNDLFY